VRFSSSKQENGDSVRRQDDLATRYCERHGLILDTRLNLRDLGVSAFKGRNALVGNFKGFLDAIKADKVGKGSVLLVESFDRISRQGIDEGYDIVKRILRAGVRIVTLSPEREYGIDATKGLSRGALEIQLILERAAEESERKSERVGKAREKGRQNAREKGILFTRRIPCWLRVEGEDGKDGVQIVKDPEAAATIRRIFRWAMRGRGFRAITKLLNAGLFPPIGRGDNWSASFVSKVLRDRSVLGEYQPHVSRDGKRIPEGNPIAGYFPAVVTEDEFNASRAAMMARRHKGGRPSKAVNLFAGLLRDARTPDLKRRKGDGSIVVPCRFHVLNKGPDNGGKLLVSYGGAQGIPGATVASFPLVPFEVAFLTMLREVDPSEVLPVAEGETPADRVAAKRARLMGLDEKIAALQSQLEEDEIPPIVASMRRLYAKRAAAADELAAAEREAATPLATAWDESRTLLEALEKSPNRVDARLRLRAAMRRTISEIWLFICGRGRDRLCCGRVELVGGAKFRHFRIMWRPPRVNAAARTPGRWWIESGNFLFDLSGDELQNWNPADDPEEASSYSEKGFRTYKRIPGKGRAFKTFPGTHHTGTIGADR
jgi:DNA invertase Pin-like site-specific DNA recombinase